MVGFGVSLAFLLCISLNYLDVLQLLGIISMKTIIILLRKRESIQAKKEEEGPPGFQVHTSITYEETEGQSYTRGNLIVEARLGQRHRSQSGLSPVFTYSLIKPFMNTYLKIK